MRETIREFLGKLKHKFVVLGLYSRLMLRYLMVDIATLLPFSRKVLHFMISETIGVRLNKSCLTVKTIEFVISRSRSSRFIKKCFRHNARRDTEISPLPALPIPVSMQGNIQTFLGLNKIKIRLIRANKCALRVVSTFKHKLLRQFIEIDLFSCIENTEKWHKILGPNTLFDERAHAIFICELSQNWIMVVKLVPLQLLIECLRTLEIRLVMKFGFEVETHICLIRNEAQVVFKRKSKPLF